MLHGKLNVIDIIKARILKLYIILYDPLGVDVTKGFLIKREVGEEKQLSCEEHLPFFRKTQVRFLALTSNHNCS